MAARHVLGPAPRVVTKLDLDPALHAQVVDIALRDQRPFAHVVREALAQYVQRAAPRRTVEQLAE